MRVYGGVCTTDRPLYFYYYYLFFFPYTILFFLSSPFCSIKTCSRLIVHPVAAAVVVVESLRRRINTVFRILYIYIYTNGRTARTKSLRREPFPFSDVRYLYAIRNDHDLSLTVRALITVIVISTGVESFRRRTDNNGRVKISPRRVRAGRHAVSARPPRRVTVRRTTRRCEMFSPQTARPGFVPRTRPPAAPQKYCVQKSEFTGHPIPGRNHFVFVQHRCAVGRTLLFCSTGPAHRCMTYLLIMYTFGVGPARPVDTARSTAEGLRHVFKPYGSVLLANTTDYT